MRRVYQNMGVLNDIDVELVRYLADEYFKATQEGYGVQLSEIDYDTPDYEMLRKLQENVYHFAGAKNYQEMKAITKELVNAEGKLRTFSEFKQVAFEILKEYNTAWMETEYNFAVAAGQMGATWTRIQENKQDIPLLKYLTVGDDRVRPAHKELEGVTRPVDDTFWDLYYPPNGWNCRCDVLQIQTGKVTPVNDIVTPDDMPALFKTNLAKNGMVFPKDHPYYTGVPEKVKEQSAKAWRKYGN